MVNTEALRNEKRSKALAWNSYSAYIFYLWHKKYSEVFWSEILNNIFTYGTILCLTFQTNNIRLASCYKDAFCGTLPWDTLPCSRLSAGFMLARVRVSWAEEEVESLRKSQLKSNSGNGSRVRPRQTLTGRSGRSFSSRIRSMGLFCNSCESKGVPRKKVCRLKRSSVRRRRVGVLHSSWKGTRNIQIRSCLRFYRLTGLKIIPLTLKRPPGSVYFSPRSAEGQTEERSFWACHRGSSAPSSACNSDPTLEGLETVRGNEVTM